jgi:UDP-N-acetylmuramate--alanine ligase
LRLTPEVAIVTNVEADHLDFYGDLDGVRRAFAAFAGRLPERGTLVLCGDDAGAAQLRSHARCRVVTYGLDGSPDWTAREVRLTAEGAAFTVYVPDGTQVAMETRLAARHNVLNTLAALAACDAAGVAPAQAAETLRRFQPPRRRMEVKGRSVHGALILDDYGHHPTEVRSTLAGLRLRYPGLRLRVAYQPHTYSRTKAFLAETGASFDDADEVAIADIYAARESDTLGVTAGDVVDAVRRAGRPVTYAPALEDVASWLAQDDGEDVVLVTMGAGDIWKAGERLVSDRSAS